MWTNEIERSMLRRERIFSRNGGMSADQRDTEEVD
jgi:hypothetical protein